jgi:hypothetical protein
MCDDSSALREVRWRPDLARGPFPRHLLGGTLGGAGLVVLVEPVFHRGEAFHRQ